MKKRKVKFLQDELGISEKMKETGESEFSCTFPFPSGLDFSFTYIFRRGGGGGPRKFSNLSIYLSETLAENASELPNS